MMDADDRALFERSLRPATEQRTGDALDRALVDLGWHDALSIDPEAAVSLLFELQGRNNCVSSALSAVLATGLGGDRNTPVLLPALGSWAPPGTLAGETLSVRGLSTHGLDTTADVSVVADRDGTTTCVVVPASQLGLRSIEGLDPRLGLVEVTGDIPDVADATEPDAWPAAVAIARLALAHELVGASRTMLELAREHALERIQFGQPIARFQAIRHRLAETLVAIETADAVLATAWEDGSSQTAAIAKSAAGRGARTTARHCQQVLAGIGFTTEHPLHHYVRRIMVLDQLLGSSHALTGALGHDVLAAKQLPPLLPL